MEYLTECILIVIFSLIYSLTLILNNKERKNFQKAIKAQEDAIKGLNYQVKERDKIIKFYKEEYKNLFK